GYGSGGSIYITATSLSGNGLLSAFGGNWSPDGRVGGGGRIAVIASTSAWTGTWRAWGNAASNGGTSAAGTVFIQSPGKNGTLIVDNNNNPTNGRGTYLGSSTTPGTYTLDS